MEWKLVVSLLLLAGAQPAIAADWHVNPLIGDDASAGTREAPLATLQKAIDIADEGSTIFLHPANAVYRQSGLIRGKSDLTIEGNGVTLDGSDPLPRQGWERFGRGLHRRRLPRTRWDRHLLIIGGVMQRMGRTQSSNSPVFPPADQLQPGQFCFVNLDDTEGWLVVCGSLEELEWAIRPNGIATSGTCRRLTVRNLRARNFLNDGFNIHGDARRLRFENIVGYDCFDEGFSAHDTCQTVVVDGRFYGNENGVADVNSSETYYRRCEFTGNVNVDVLLTGKTHELFDCRIVNTTSAVALSAGPRVEEQPFSLRLDRVSIVGKRPAAATRVRVSGGLLDIVDSVIENVDFQPLGATIRTSDLRVLGTDKASAP